MFYLAHVALVTMIVLEVLTIRLKTQNKMKGLFLQYLAFQFIWTLSVVLQRYSVRYGKTSLIIFFENTTYLGISFISVIVLIISMSIYYSTHQTMKWIRYLYIVPVITQIVIWTNRWHHLFFVSINVNDIRESQVGLYFYVHTVYSYACLMIGTFYVIYHASRERGRRNSALKAFLLCLGTAVPLIVNVCFTLNMPSVDNLSTPVAFLVTCITYYLLLFRYNILQISPAVMKQVIDMTSDLYAVIDENMMIIDYNEPFEQIFSKLINLKRKIPLADALQGRGFPITIEELLPVIDECRTKQDTIIKDLGVMVDDAAMYFSVEFSPLLIDSIYYGCIILFRDITRAVNDMEQIKANQDQLIKQERLASLGQLISGIAHNLNTPIMAISGRAESLEFLVDEYVNSLEDNKVTRDDHREIASDMRGEIENIRIHTSYISEIISAVKEQAVMLSVEAKESFTIRDLTKRIDLLLRHVLIRNKCNLIYEIEMDDQIAINSGDISSLIQVIDNTIMNAMQAYEGAPGEILVRISQSDGEIIFTISDKAGGIPIDIQEKLFQQMITSKGKDGTGLGLYISYSTIVGIFGGKMWYNSISGVGTDMHIAIPIMV